ncbi:hypothetical protein EV126DRAFT_527544 [Verticillium dahliae]|nr:hypothetical protein EV126DRAFT_527544 [Verticillium dahliae]
MSMPGPPPPGQGIPLQPGQMPSPEQIQAMRRQLEADAQKAGMTVPEFAQRMAAAQRAQQQGGQPGQPGQAHPHQHGPPGPHPGPPPGARPGAAQPITPGPPNPAALALATFLRGQELKPRTCILNGERKDMFKVKRALRALQSPAYEKARKKNPLLPEITDRPRSQEAQAREGPLDRQIEPQQEAKEEMYYSGSTRQPVMRKVYAAIALLVIFLIVCYPLWPLKLRQGVYYL